MKFSSLFFPSKFRKLVPCLYQYFNNFDYECFILCTYSEFFSVDNKRPGYCICWATIYCWEDSWSSCCRNLSEALSLPQFGVQFWIQSTCLYCQVRFSSFPFTLLLVARNLPLRHFWQCSYSTLRKLLRPLQVNYSFNIHCDHLVYV